MRDPAASAASDRRVNSPATATLSETDALLEAAGYDPVSVDELAERTHMPLMTIHAGLLALEMQGRIEMLAGGMYRRLH